MSPHATSQADHFRERLRGTEQVIASLDAHVDTAAAIADRLKACLREGGTIYTCGNGGSAAEAMHLAEELIGRYHGDRPPLRAVCLNADPAALTCIANDFGFEQVFARQCEAMARAGDVVVVLSTSGKSANVKTALEAARTNGATTVGLLGGDGGACLPLCDHAIVIDAAHSAHVQEAHLVLIHLFCEALE